MAKKIIEVQQEEELFGMDRYDPTCFAVEILDVKYEKIEVDELTSYCWRLAKLIDYFINFNF